MDFMDLKRKHTKVSGATVTGSPRIFLPYPVKLVFKFLWSRTLLKLTVHGQPLKKIASRLLVFSDQGGDEKIKKRRPRRGGEFNREASKLNG